MPESKTTKQKVGAKPKMRAKMFTLDKDQVALARRRTEFLVTHAFDMSPHELAMLAYVQGVRDMVEFTYGK